MPKAMVLAVMLGALLAGAAGCAKYPVVLNASAPAPTVATQAPGK